MNTESTNEPVEPSDEGKNPADQKSTDQKSTDRASTGQAVSAQSSAVQSEQAEPSEGQSSEGQSSEIQSPEIQSPEIQSSVIKSAEVKAPTQHVLSAPPPTRAFAIAAVVTVVGAVFVVLSRAQGWPAAMLVLAVVVTVLGVGLFAAGAYAMTRMRIRGELDAAGYHFRSPDGDSTGDWIDISKVTASESGHRITLVGRDGSKQDVLFPVGNEAPDMERLVDDITTRLVESRRS